MKFRANEGLSPRTGEDKKVIESFYILLLLAQGKIKGKRIKRKKEDDGKIARRVHGSLDNMEGKSMIYLGCLFLSHLITTLLVTYLIQTFLATLDNNLFLTNLNHTSCHFITNCSDCT